MADKGRIIVLADRAEDVVIVTPKSLHRARGQVGRELLISESVSDSDRVKMLEVVIPCFATSPASPNSEEVDRG